jgi:NADPH:quinone reductase and related Zn-dependent oxidoreductases
MIKRILKWTFLLLLLGLFVWFEYTYWTSTNDCDRKNAAAPNNPMKAVTYCEYGLANLKIDNVEKPTPTDDQVLVRVRAASINPYDWHFIEGSPKLMRVMIGGLRKPKDTRLGVDFAGTVEAVGKNVTQFKVGDEVFGGKGGAFAEYVTPKADRAIAIKPANVTFEEAAAVNIAGLTALQGLRDKGKVQPGQKVLINGASGGVGTFAVQIAKIFGAEVTGVCSTRNIDLVKSLGADRVIDYTKEDFTKGDQKYDVIIDNVANRTLSENRKVLTANGIYVLIGGGSANEQGFFGALKLPLKAFIYSKFVNQKMGMMMAEMKQTDLQYFAEQMQSGKIKAVIDRTYKLDEIQKAVAYVEEGHARGKVIVTVD